MALLEVKDLHVFYGNIEALKGVSISAEAGQIVAILGGNGAGKTTTLRAVSGLLRPRSGSVIFNGKNLVGMSAHNVVSLGLSHVPEGRRIFNRLTVRENLMMGAFLRSDSGIEADLQRVFALFPRLRERIAQVAGTLSGGEQQMLAIGRALMTRPRLLLLDEPSMGLAPILVEKIFEIIQTINGEGTTVLLVEQNALMALQIAQRGYVLETGRVTLTDNAAALRENEQVRKAYLGES